NKSFAFVKEYLENFDEEFYSSIVTGQKNAAKKFLNNPHNENLIKGAIEGFRQRYIHHDNAVPVFSDTDVFTESFVKQFNENANLLNRECKSYFDQIQALPEEKRDEKRTSFMQKALIVEAKTGMLLSQKGVKDLILLSSFREAIGLDDPRRPLLGHEKPLHDRCLDHGYLLHNPRTKSMPAMIATGDPTMGQHLGKSYLEHIDDLRYKELNATVATFTDRTQELIDTQFKHIVDLLASRSYKSYDDQADYLTKWVKTDVQAFFDWLVDHPDQHYSAHLCDLLHDLCSNEKTKKIISDIILAGQGAMIPLMFFGGPIAIVAEGGLILLTIVNGTIMYSIIADIGANQDRIAWSAWEGSFQSMSAALLQQGLEADKRMEKLWLAVEGVIFVAADLKAIARLRLKISHSLDMLKPINREIAQVRREMVESLQRRSQYANNELLSNPDLRHPSIVSDAEFDDIINTLSNTPARNMDEAMEQLRKRYPHLFEASAGLLAAMAASVGQLWRDTRNRIADIPIIRLALLKSTMAFHRLAGGVLDMHQALVKHLNACRRLTFSNGEPLLRNSDIEDLLIKINRSSEYLVYVIDESDGLLKVMRRQDQSKRQILDNFLDEFFDASTTSPRFREYVNDLLINGEVNYNELETFLTSLRKGLIEHGEEGFKWEIEHVKALKQVMEFAKINRHYASIKEMPAEWAKYFDPNYATHRTQEIFENSYDLWKVATWKYTSQRNAYGRWNKALPPRPEFTDSSLGERFIRHRNRYQTYYEKKLKKGRDMRHDNGHLFTDDDAHQYAMKRTELYKSIDTQCSMPYSALRKQSGAQFKKVKVWISAAGSIPAYAIQRWDQPKDANWTKIIGFDVILSLFGASLKAGAFAKEGRGAFAKMFWDWVAGRQVGAYDWAGHQILFGKKGVDPDPILEQFVRELNTVGAIDPSYAMLGDLWGHDFEMEVARSRFRMATNQELNLENFLNQFPTFMQENPNFIQEFKDKMQHILTQGQTEDDVTRILGWNDVAEEDPLYHEEITALIADLMYKEKFDLYAWDEIDLGFLGVDQTVDPNIQTGDVSMDRYLYYALFFDFARMIPNYKLSKFIFRNLCMYRHKAAAVFAMAALTESVYKFGIEKPFQYWSREGLTGR
ncbi:MAG: hypothetical protein KDK51_00905, partial [Deltaproteobacteria bacterium]|nr:hypothetical protein [Deltaproteobacteria bacterium]